MKSALDMLFEDIQKSEVKQTALSRRPYYDYHSMLYKDAVQAAAAELAAKDARIAELEAERRQLFGVAVRAFNALESLGVTSNELPGKLPELDRYLANDLDDKLWDEIEAARAASEAGRG